ncbi:MAG: MarR family transcriptional regulator [Ruminococcaceae bacterium]|nr:MarR family transcriptional regulator [Oscillospiraceae bacterium]
MENKLTEELRRFNYLVGGIDQVYHEAALKLGLSDSEMAVLYTICGEGKPCPLSLICRLAGLSKQTANSALRKLENSGVIRLEAVDGKQKSAALTDKGRTLAEHTVSKIISAENRIFDSWTERERTEYIRLTQNYLNAFRAEIDKL